MNTFKPVVSTLEKNKQKLIMIRYFSIFRLETEQKPPENKSTKSPERNLHDFMTLASMFILERCKSKHIYFS